MTSSFLLMSQLNIDDLNMDTTKFGLSNYIPYSNTYAVCPGIVNTHIFDDVPLLIKLGVRTSTYFSTSPDEVKY